MTNIVFKPFDKMPRLSREVVITEKIDGTNAVIHISEEGKFLTGSRTRWITTSTDNYGFAAWAQEHKDELMQLGVGTHYGEWWGKGIQRNYSLPERRFSLFNTHRWGETRPTCCHIVPILAIIPRLDYWSIKSTLSRLMQTGSYASPGFMNPEGIVAYHKAGNLLFKMTMDDEPKG